MIFDHANARQYDANQHANYHFISAKICDINSSDIRVIQMLTHL